MKTCDLLILNALGLHARAAAKFVHTAGRFTSHIRVGRGDREVDGKSIMGLLLLAAPHGSEIHIIAEGADEGEAIEALCALVACGFDEGPGESPPGGPFDKVQGRP